MILAWESPVGEQNRTNQNTHRRTSGRSPSPLIQEDSSAPPMAVMMSFGCVVLFKSNPDFGQFHCWTWIIAFTSIQSWPQTYWTTRISNSTQSEMSFRCSLAWLDSILWWCVQFQSPNESPSTSPSQKRCFQRLEHWDTRWKSSGTKWLRAICALQVKLNFLRWIKKKLESARRKKMM